MLNDPLSDRELQVLHQLKEGISNKEIGIRLGITDGTVKIHLGQAMRKIGVKNRTQAALWMMKNMSEAA
jgi:two-component system nitrate/nitrite response regulator NarL